MEKNLILAVILSFIILFIWYSLFTPKQQQVAPEKEAIHGEQGIDLPEKVTLPPPAQPDAAPDEIEKPAATLIKEKEIRVETPLYSAVFSNKGATIKSFKLKKYRVNIEPDSPPVELVKLKQDDNYFFSADFYNPQAANDDRAVYKVDEDPINLVENSSPNDLTFEYSRPDGVSISQTFIFHPDRYDIGLTVAVANNSEYQAEGNIRANINNLPTENKSSYYSFIGTALLIDGELEEIKQKKMKEDKYLSGRIEWVAYEDDYFMSAIIPEDQKDGSFTARLSSSGVISAAYSAPSVSLRPLESVSEKFMLYMGPKDLDTLKKFGKNLDLAVHFGFFDIIAKPLHFVLRFFNRYVHNYGVSIILLTILVKIILWPLTHKSYKSMKEMQKLQPLMAKIREKYKDDREQMQRELMGLYKTYKVNPMGGCLPLLIQFPILFAMFRILGNSIELRHAPFMLWITDLSAPDRLFNFPFKIPLMSPPYGIPVLTLLMGASMFIQQKMQPTPGGDPAQAKVMMFLPIIFTIMFINFPSGLVLYWLLSNIITIGQQYGIKKRPS